MLWSERAGHLCTMMPLPNKGFTSLNNLTTRQLRRETAPFYWVKIHARQEPQVLSKARSKAGSVIVALTAAWSTESRAPALGTLVQWCHCLPHGGRAEGHLGRGKLFPGAMFPPSFPGLRAVWPCKGRAAGCGFFRMCVAHTTPQFADPL